MPTNTQSKQTGVVLVLSLIMLLLLTLIAISAMQITQLDQKMASNMHARNLALQAAESALRDAEDSIAAGDFMVGVSEIAKNVYRVTATGSDHNGTASVTLQTTYHHAASTASIIQPNRRLTWKEVTP